MTWHVDPTLLERYARDEVADTTRLSIDAHLVGCDRCRAQLAEHADAARLARVWNGVAAEIAASRAGGAAHGPARSGLLSDRALRVAVPVAALALLAGAVLRAVTVAEDSTPGESVAVDDLRTSPDAGTGPGTDAGRGPAPPFGATGGNGSGADAAPTAPPAASPTPGGEVQAAEVGLTPFDACDDLRAHLRAEGLERVTARGLPDRGGRTSPGRPATTSPDASTTGGDGGGADAGQPRFSGTNVQEEGVDEPDLLKTDGRHGFVALDGRLRVVDVDAGRPSVVTEMDLEGRRGYDLLLAGGRLLALRTSYDDAGHDGDPADTAPAHPVTELTLLDVSDPADPTVLHRAEADGQLVSARQVGPVARVVVESEPQLPFVHPDEERSEEEARAHNRRVVADAPLDQWLPDVTIRHGDDSPRSQRLASCQRTHAPARFSGFGTVSVLTVDLAGDFTDLDGTSVLADGRVVYSSARNLYVATSRSVAAEDRDAETNAAYTTELHAFDVTDSATARYLASGQVPGHVHNQFSLSEHEGVLRVVTTEGAPWGDGTESALRVLERREDLLVPIGEVGGLGRGERVYAVRFVGDIGYVVTFRRIDPLYTVDVSDPTAPRVTGELKITGYSAYLHPTGPGRLLGVGQDATEEGRTRGTQLSAFDVSDLTDPRRTSQVTLGRGSSEVEFDHHAFLYWPDADLVMVPVTTWNSDEDGSRWSGAAGFTLRDGQLERRGRVTHPTPEGSGSSWNPPVLRSFVVDETVFTVSERGVLGSDVETLERRGWAPFEDTDDDGDHGGGDGGGDGSGGDDGGDDSDGEDESGLIGDPPASA